MKSGGTIYPQLLNECVSSILKNTVSSIPASDRPKFDKLTGLWASNSLFNLQALQGLTAPAVTAPAIVASTSRDPRAKRTSNHASPLGSPQIPIANLASASLIKPAFPLPYSSLQQLLGGNSAIPENNHQAFNYDDEDKLDSANNKLTNPPQMQFQSIAPQTQALATM